MVNHQAFFTVFTLLTILNHTMFSSFFVQPQVMQELASQHTALPFRQGFVRDCVSLLVRRAYTARSIDRIKEPPFL